MTTLEFFTLEYDKLLYELIKEKTMTSVGLNLSGVKLLFDDNSTFELKDVTFAFFDSVEGAIHINIEDPFFKYVSAKEHAIDRLLFILFHETMHRLLNHVQRKGTKDANIWNVAADFEIHNMLYAYCESFEASNTSMFRDRFKYIKAYLDYCDNSFRYDKTIGDDFEDLTTGCFKKEYIGMTAEEIYENLALNSRQGNDGTVEDISSSTHTLSSGAKVSVSDITMNDGKKITTINSVEQDDDNDESTNSNDEQLQQQLLKCEIENLNEELTKGETSTKLKQFLGKLIEVKIDWTKILAASITSILEKSDTFTWSKPRTSTMLLDVYLPALNEEDSKYGTVIIARDESGSMSDDDLRKATDVIISAKEKYSRVILLKHDEKIVSEKVYEEIDDDAKSEIMTSEARGGTSHKEVFEYIKDYYVKNKFNNDEKTLACVILMTDCCSDIQQYQRLVPDEVPLIYLVKKTEYTSYVCRGIRGQLIYI